MRAITAVIVAAFLLVSFGAHAESCRGGGYPIEIPAGYQHDRWVSGQQPGDLRFEHDGYTAVFDGPDDDFDDPKLPNLLAQPHWVSQEVRRFARDGLFVTPEGFERPSPWYEMSELDFLLSQPGVTEKNLDPSYANEALIWNRGHMATRHLVNRVSPEAGCNSHKFTNAIPQYWSLNQGDWLALENHVGALANKHGKAWHISGPIFYRGVAIETIGAPGEVKIAIPHAVYKVIVFLVNDDIFVRAFLFAQPNYAKVKAIMTANGGHKPSMGYRNCRGTSQESYDFQPYASSLSQIEKLTGITFFPKATAAEKETLDKLSSRRIWRVEARFFEAPCGADQDD